MKYQSVAQYLREYIVLHANEPLHPLPTEQDLQDRFGVSRQTVRKAISILKEEGLINKLFVMGCLSQRYKEELEGKFVIYERKCV